MKSWKTVLTTIPKIIEITVTIDNASASSANGYCYFYNFGDSSKYSFSTFQWSYIYYTDVYEMNFGSGVLPQASTVDGFRVIPNSGTFSGTLSLYGIAES